MDSDRPFKCEPCGKSFHRRYHLKRHHLICKGEATNKLTCVKCNKQFKLKKTLKVHQIKCDTKKTNLCFECDESFLIYSGLVEHNKMFHLHEECYFCNYFGHIKNGKRHRKIVHKGIRPSTSLNVKSSITKSRFKCNKCEKMFHDKSTLNRHIKKCSYKTDFKNLWNGMWIWRK